MKSGKTPISRVVLSGRSWSVAGKGLYCFQGLVDGQPAELRVAEEIAFDFLGAWTPSREKCLEILRLHRADLAKALQSILHVVGDPDHNGHYRLTLNDMERGGTTVHTAPPEPIDLAKARETKS